nr:glycosyltransferase family 4 protein [Bacteroidota bacterium]
EYYRKGIDMVFDVAPLFPDASFTVIGDTSQMPKKIPSNIKIVPFVDNEKLKDYLSQHQFYLQLSLAEGFPNALCEAMLCECIPIGSNVFGIPFIIGETGFVLKKRNVTDLKTLMDIALNSQKEFLSSAARKRIELNFPLERRKKEFLNIISSMINKQS